MALRSGVDRRMIARWLKKKKEIVESVKQRKAFMLSKPSTQIMCEPMEINLKNWIKSSRLQNNCIDSELKLV